MRIAASREPTDRTRSAALVALLIAARARASPPAHADVGEQIILRCTHGQSLSGFSQSAYRQALKELSADTEEYSACGQQIRQAQLAAAAGGRGSGGGAGRSAPHRSRSPPRPPTARDRARPASAAPDRSSWAARSSIPGVVHADVASALSSLPTPAARAARVHARVPAALAGGALASVSVPAAPTEPRRRRRRRAGAARGAGASAGARARRAAGAAAARRAAVVADAAGRRRLLLVTFYAKGGLNLETMTTTEMALTIGAGVLVAASSLAGARRARAPVRRCGRSACCSRSRCSRRSRSCGRCSPTHSWQDAGRMLAYSGVFGAGGGARARGPRALAGGARRARRWRRSSCAATRWLTKVFPASTRPNTSARLQEPYGYWNAIGLTAAMGVIGCLWLGARRSGHALLQRARLPGLGLLLLTLLLAYSRGALRGARGRRWCCGSASCRCACAAPRLLIVAALGAGAVVALGLLQARAQRRRRPARANGRPPATSSARWWWRWCSC